MKKLKFLATRHLIKPEKDLNIEKQMNISILARLNVIDTSNYLAKASINFLFIYFLFIYLPFLTSS